MHVETTLRLPRIGCQSCMKKVVNALETVQSVGITATDVPGKTVTIGYDDEQTTLRQIAQTLRTVGHSTVMTTLSGENLAAV